ncbi:HNH endonuclease [Lactobacillus apis]|uniref:HNH endonuclease n=1 Tax=Lactobacillus apis TaxID=303541 RepID=UPI0016504987|nr:HNH endonuclease signature motif containing protein [Lactobacillus apis]MBC6361646.1 HNH endonuclease [Lactobacillus apis]
MSAKDNDYTKNSDDKFYRTKKWTTTKNSRIKEDDNTCQVCGKKYKDTNEFNVDHIIMRRLLPKDQWYDKTNLWTLCKCCNGIKQSLEQSFDCKKLKETKKSEWIKYIRNSEKYCEGECQH